MADPDLLGDFEDETITAPAAARPPGPVTDALVLADIMTKAKTSAGEPRPTIEEMVVLLTQLRYEIEDDQQRLVAVGDRVDPYHPYMRRAAVLGACSNFLGAVQGNKAAVKRVLQGGAS